MVKAKVRAGLLLTIIAAATNLCGCIATSLSHVDKDPEFNWDALKRDQILMTPLIDLRQNSLAPEKHREKLKFFSDPERIAYAEKFKQVFFKLRKDIRVFGAGGAFEHIANQPALLDVTRAVVAKTPVENAKWLQLVSGAQDIRFVFFFTVTGERLYYDYSYSGPDKSREYGIKTYRATREITARLALWDSLKNKTVWSGTQIIDPTATHTVKMPKLNKSGGVVLNLNSLGLDAWDVGASSLAQELEHHRSRFPAFPDREPEFSASFDDFALGLPINPSEENLIEYSWFTYHRPELGLRLAQLGRHNVSALQIGSSSILHNFYRVGGALLMPVSVSKIVFKDIKYNVSSFHFGPTFDLEWTLGSDLRLLTGVMAGSATFNIKEQTNGDAPGSGSTPPEGETTEVDKGTTDAAWYLWPRAMFLFGERRGFQWGIGACWRAYDTIDEPILKANRPPPWGIDASVAYSIRGF